MANYDLPIDLDATYADSAVDPSIKQHQQIHDTVDRVIRLYDTSIESASVAQVPMWNGTAYAPALAQSRGVKNTQTASYTAVAADVGKEIEMDVATANNLTINANVFSADQQVYWTQLGVGLTTFVAGAGMTLRSLDGSLVSNGQYASGRIRFRSPTEAFISGTNLSIVSVKSFGAVGDGVADDTAAIAAALATGKPVHFPPGTYITSPFTIGANRAVRGAGVGLTTLKLKSGSNSSFVTLLDAHDSLLTDVTLDGNKAGNTSSGFTAVLLVDTTAGNALSSYHLTVDRLVIVNGANNGITVLDRWTAGQSAQYNWVFQMSNIDVESCNGYGMFDESSDNRFSNFYFTQNAKADLYLLGASSNLYVNFKCGEGGATHATSPPTKTDGANVLLDTVTRCWFTNFDIQSGNWDGLYAKDCRYLTFNGVDSQNNDNWGYYFVNCKGIRGTTSTSETSTLSNTAGDYYFDAACSLNNLEANPASVSGATAPVITNLGGVTNVVNTGPPAATPNPLNLNMKGWSCDPADSSGAGSMPAATHFAAKVFISGTQTITNVLACTTVAAVTAANAYVALYDSAGNLIAGTQSADVSATWNATLGLKTFALGATATVSNDFVYVSLWINSAGTTPTVVRGGSGAHVNMGTTTGVASATSPRFGTAANAYTSSGTVAPATLGSITGGVQNSWTIGLS